MPLTDEQRRKILAGRAQASPTPSSAGSQTFETATERFLEPVEKQYPGQIAVEAGGRFLGRLARERETQSGLEASYSAKSAQAARGFGDTANIAVAERQMLQESFPKDGDSYERRLTKEQSLFDPTLGFFPTKKRLLQSIMSRQAPMVPSGISAGGKVTFRADPAIEAAKRQAATDLSRLEQTEVLYQQMYEEAARKMSPILSQPEGQIIVNPKTGERRIYRDGAWQTLTP